MRMTLRFQAVLWMAGILTVSSANAQVSSISQWRGPDRTGVYPDRDLLKSWPEEGLKTSVRISGMGKGDSSPVVHKEKVYISGIKDTIEYISCYTTKGEFQWEEAFGHAWNKSYPESRSTPTIEKGKVFIISGSGEVACHDAKTGKQIWYVDADSVYAGEIWIHGVSESPLLTNDAVIYTTGGEESSLIALNKESGALLWKAESLGGARGYASPILVNHHGIDMIIAQTANHALGVIPDTGEILWSHDLMQYHEKSIGKGNNINTPVYKDGKVFITSGYDHPGILFDIAKDARSVEILWKNYDIDVHLGGVILKDDYLYASNWQSNSMGKWVCVDWNTGELKWEEKWFSKGSIIMADDLLYIYEEKSGHAGLLRPNPEKFDLISTIQFNEGSGPHWAHPSIYAGILYLRHGEVIVGYDIKSKSYK